MIHRILSILAILFTLCVITLGLAFPVQSLTFVLGAAATLLRLIARIRTEPVNYFFWFRAGLMALAVVADAALLSALIAQVRGLRQRSL